MYATDKLAKGFDWWTSAGELREIIDGYDCAIIKGRLYKQIKVDRRNGVPEGAIPRNDYISPSYCRLPCWMPVKRSEVTDKKYIAALENTHWVCKDGVYVVVGTRIKLNPYGLDDVFLEKQYRIRVKDCERTFEGMREYFRIHPIYGIAVFDERGIPRAQMKRSDFGFRWPPRKDDEDES